MDEERRKAYQDRAQARVREWEAKLDELGARARRAEAELRLKLQDEESDLRKKLDEARARLRDMKDASGDGWDEIRAGAEKLWTDLRAAWDRSAEPQADGDPGPATPRHDFDGPEEGDAGRGAPV